ncbi:leucine-rich repeat-containing protein 63 [Pseudophryne corroboree]|uniref:leucine-rich repeat-containing protein 63 n=1 Tax=Pseudophryne corroboree TaxID=495146 RepID=UPI0030814CEE
MEFPCLSLEPPKLLRRPLPPKVLPVLNVKRPVTIKEKGVTPLYIQQQLQDHSSVQRSDYDSNESPTTFSVEQGNLFSKNWTLDQRAPTPAASRLNSDDYPVNWNSRIQGQHKYAVSEQTQDGELMHRGPADFPSKRRHRQRVVNVLPSVSDSVYYQHSAPEFTFKDISAHHAGNVADVTNKHMVSRLNYSSLEDSIARLQQKIQNKVHSVVLSSCSIPEISKRIPKYQLALEQQLARIKEGGVECIPNIGDGSIHQFFNSQSLQDSGTLYRDQSKMIATHCDLAVLECLVHGGNSLSLKAYFISKLPDLTPLRNTLFYLNLSFNEFWQFPTEVYKLEHLESLKLRNNPIKEIPYGVHKLKKIRTFIMSFCSLSSLPAGLFQLPYLQVLDVSYNNITSISNDISNLRALEFLNVEGNSLPALPCGALKLRLKHLRVGNNQMHPLLWAENTQIGPQRLIDLSAMSFAKNNMFRYFTVPREVKHILRSLKICDCCKGVLSGDGLRFIRPCNKIFGIRKLPFVFHACSPSCYRSFMSQTDSLTQHLYGS